MMLTLVAVIAFAGAAFLAALSLLGGPQDRSAVRLAQLAGGGPVDMGERRVEQRPESALRRRGGLERRLAEVPLLASWRTDLERAGLPWQLRDYIGVVAAVGFGVGATAALVAGTLLAAIPAAAVGAGLPVLLVKRKVARRAAKLNEQVMETIDLVASSLRSGFGFVQSLELAAREQPEPISGEIARTVYEMNLGVEMDEALERLVERTGDQDLDLVITAVLIQRRVGGNLAEVLMNISQTIRNRVRVRGEIRTLTAQARMSAWIVGLLPFALGGAMLALNPAYMSVLWTEPVGRLLMGVAAVMQVIGVFMVRRMAAIEY